MPFCAAQGQRHAGIVRIPNAQWQANSTQAVLPTRCAITDFNRPVADHGLRAGAKSRQRHHAVAVWLYAADADCARALIWTAGRWMRREPATTGIGERGVTTRQLFGRTQRITARPHSDRGAATDARRVGASPPRSGPAARSPLSPPRKPLARCRRRVRRLSRGGLSAGNTAPVHVMLMVVVPVNTTDVRGRAGLQSRLDVSRPAHHLWRSNRRRCGARAIGAIAGHQNIRAVALVRELDNGELPVSMSGDGVSQNGGSVATMC